jgi:outer membrane protein assembly factor BamB
VKIVPDENAIYIVDKDTCYKFTKGEEIWRFKSQGVITNFLVEKEAVYLSSLENHLYKINSATGELLWKYKTKLGEKFYSFCKGNNVIYVTTQDKIFAFSLSGKEKWRRKGFLFPSVTVRNQTIFVISVKGKVSALNERGDLLWECILEKGLRSYPVNWRSWGGRSEEAGEFYFKGEKIYVSGEKDLWAIDCKRGKIEWHFASKRSSNLAPVILNDDIYFVADETITVVDLTGKIKWEYKAKSAFCTYPIVDKEKYIYIGNLDGNLYIFSSNGILEKKINIKKIFPGGAIVIKEGILCVLSSNKLIALNVDAIHKDILNKTKK